MKIREIRLQNGIFVYKAGISFTKWDFHLQRETLGLQTGLSLYISPSIGSVLGYKWDDILLVNVENVSNVTKLILIIFYIVIFKNTELPNSFFIRFASKNEALLDRRN